MTNRIWPTNSSPDFSSYADGWTGLRMSFTTFYKNSFIIASLAVVGNLIACSLTALPSPGCSFGAGGLVRADAGHADAALSRDAGAAVCHVPETRLVNTFLPLIVQKFLAVDAFFIFLMVQFFSGIPREIDEAAIMDGCGPWRICCKIMLPLSTPVLATAAIFSFIWTYDDFPGPLPYLNDMLPAPCRWRCGPSSIPRGGESLYGELFAMSALSLVPVFVVFLLFQRLIIRGVAQGALKR